MVDERPSVARARSRRLPEAAARSRREVLRAGAALGALAVTRSLRGGGVLRADPPEYDCIVLGAGIAGVTAARDLHYAGLRVALVEGAARVGGRMFTVRDFVCHPSWAAAASRYPIEAGAEYVHVGDQERYADFFAELESHGFVRRKLPKYQRNRLAFADWKHNPKNLILSLLREPNLIPTVSQLGGIEDYDLAGDTPAGAYVAGKSYKGKGLELARYTLSSHTPGLLFDPAVDQRVPSALASCSPARSALDTISVAGIRADQLPHQLYSESAEYRLERPGAAEPDLCGYDSLPRAIADQFSNPAQNPSGRAGELLLAHRVVRVERRAEGIAVITENQTGQRELVGRSALSTFSVGMLDPERGEGDRIFGPLLSSAKRAALQSVRMGAITKFSLEFRRSWWGKKCKMTVMSHPGGCARTFFSAFPDRKQGPYVLTGLLMNQDHELVRDLDDHAAAQHLLDVLQQLFAPKAPRWTPAAILVARPDGQPNFRRQDWERDPFARGGNSYIAFRDGVKTEAVSRLREELRDPRDSMPLFWAGEATAPAYRAEYQPLSVHGAYISGVEAAKDIREYLASAVAALEAFRSTIEAKQGAIRQQQKRGPAKETLVVTLSASEDRQLALYAQRLTGGNRSLAARDVCRAGLYLQQHRPARLSAGGQATPARVEFQLTEAELRQVDQHARSEFAGDRSRTLRALLRLGLQASERTLASAE